MKYTEVQSQQKAFTQNPSLSNNPKILAHYLVCSATTECIQCCQYSTFIHRLVTNIVIWWPTLWMHNVVNISAHPGCHPQRLTFEIDKSNIYHWKSMYFIYITHYIIYSAWYIYIYIVYIEVNISACPVCHPQRLTFEDFAFFNQREDNHALLSPSLAIMFICGGCPQKVTVRIDWKGFYASNANLNILNIFTPKLTNGWPKVSFFILDAWQIEFFCIVYCSASVFVWTMA